MSTSTEKAAGVHPNAEIAVCCIHVMPYPLCSGLLNSPSAFVGTSSTAAAV